MPPLYFYNMKIGLIDIDNRENLDNCFPNLPLMKISAFYKKLGYFVEWYDANKRYDIVYASKVFSFTREKQEPINADHVYFGGSGFAINLKDGIETYDKTMDDNLPAIVEHIYPDYDLYRIENTAYGFLSRGCPRNCGFCHVSQKEGCKSIKVANLDEFWNGQKYIEVMDPNTLACSEWKDILNQLIESGSYVNFNQGLDIRLMTAQKAEMLSQIKIKDVHFAYDRYSDKKKH